MRNLKDLARQSYTHGNLDDRKATKVASFLTRHELKTYIRFLQDLESQKQITVTSSSKLNPEMRNQLENKFKNKEINYLVDPDLLVGVKVTGSDFTYELSLERNLNDAVSYLGSI